MKPSRSVVKPLPVFVLVFAVAVALVPLLAGMVPVLRAQTSQPIAPFSPPAVVPGGVAVPKDLPRLVTPVVGQPGMSLSQEQRRRYQWQDANRNSPRANADGNIITYLDVRKVVTPLIPALIRECKGDYASFESRLNALTVERVLDMTTRKLIVREFYAKGGVLAPSFITSRIEQKIQLQHGGSRDEYLNVLKYRGLTPLEDRRQVEEDIIVEFFFGEVYKGIDEVSPKKIADFYEQNKARFFTAPEQFRCRVIMLAPGAAETNADVLFQKQFVLDELKKGVPFNRLVPQYLNKDVARFEDGGAASWRNASDMGERMLAALRAVKDGEVAAPLELKDPSGRLNVYFFQRVEHRAGGAVPLAEVRDNIAYEILKGERAAAAEASVARLREKYFVRYY